MSRPPKETRKDQRKNPHKPDELVVVSGASSGIGAATAQALAARGYHVLAGVRTDSEADAVRADRIEPVTLDITVPEHIEALARRIADDPERRVLRVLVNNAGIEINAPVEVLPLALWREQFEVNLFGHIAVIQALLPFLRRSRGRIVNISSVGGVAAGPSSGPMREPSSPSKRPATPCAARSRRTVCRWSSSSPAASGPRWPPAAVTSPSNSPPR